MPSDSVAPGFAPVIQHQESAIAEKIAVFFGFRLVERIALVQAPLPVSKATHSYTPPALTAPSADVAAIEDDELRNALASLERHLQPKA